ncbi:uncharacterized protein TNCV_3807131 [Trichonephila clavipes]|nr:uncharacterized protein TNCV_3807131 [Trichonephila clavipes]
MVTVELSYECITRSVLIDECRIKHRISQRLHLQLRETRFFHDTRHDDGRRRAVRNSSLEESILNVVADRVKNKSCCSSRNSTRGLLATDHVILNHGQVKWTTPELAPPLLTTTPHQREDVSALDRFNVHRCPTRRVFSGTGLDPVTKQATVRYLYHSATAASL